MVLTFELAEAGTTVRVNRDDDANGPRLHIEQLGASSIWLCPLELEALVSAEDHVFSRVADIAGRSTSGNPDGRDRESVLTIANEFAHVTARRATTPPDGLMLVDNRSGEAISLSVTALGQLSRCQHSALVELVAP